MELKFWIYIIIGAIYVLSKLRKKSGSNPGENPDFERRTNQPKVDVPVGSSPKEKTLTFEELLREITVAKTEKEYPSSPSKPTYVDYDDDLKDEEQDLEEIPVDYRVKDSIYSTYDEAKQVAFNRPSLEVTMNVQDTDVKFGKFKVFDEQEQPNFLEKYVRELNDPEGFKKAFVMSEILNRKY